MQEQINILDTPQWTRQIWQGGAYPPYREGLLLEEYFHNYFLTHKPKIPNYVKYIPIYWTNLYLMYGQREKLQKEFLNNIINSDDVFFTVSQHDDGPGYNILPKNTIIFSAGGNYKHENIVPIPLVSSKIPRLLYDVNQEKDILVSFVGSDTHPIRKTMIEKIMQNDHIKNNAAIILRPHSGGFTDKDLRTFINITNRSMFTLCPRGYGPTSFRLYEAMQLKSIPIYITDDFYIPYRDTLNWNKLAKFVGHETISNGGLENAILAGHENNNDMLEYTSKIYDDCFSLEGVCENIIREVNIRARKML